MKLPPLIVNPAGRRQRMRITDAIKIMAPNLPGPRTRLNLDPEHERRLARRREQYQQRGGKKKRKG